MKIKLDNGWAIYSNKCVNSNWPARFLAREDQEYCQCSFGDCKVAVDISYNDHNPYRYILTEQELKRLPVANMQSFTLPIMKPVELLAWLEEHRS